MRHDHFKMMIAAVLAMLVLNVSAADVDADAARSLASSFLKSQSRGKLLGNNAALRLDYVEKSSRDATKSDFYVFNMTNGGAFVIISGEDRAEQVLAYGNGNFDMESAPANVKWWLSQYKAQIEFVRAHASSADASANRPIKAPAPRHTVPPIAPMLTSLWSQDEPYCVQCPVYGGEYCATGCVATAMAQVMYFWKYPDELPALPTYWTYSLSLEVPALPGTRLDWENMIDVYSRGYTAEQGAAVATLMRYCGQSCYMDYNPDGSGAAEEDQLGGLKLFGYNPGASNLERDNYIDSEWEAMLYNDLSEGHPVLYSGSAQDAGHAFVLDGYKDGLYHVNWGWGGYYDGYFSIDAMLDEDLSGFNYAQRMLNQVYPVENGNETPTCDFEVNGIYYNVNGNEVSVTCRDTRYNSYSGVVTVPETVTHDGKTYRVTAIGDNAFRNCAALTAVNYGNGIKTIGAKAFRNCQQMKNIRIGKSVTEIGENAFYGCYRIERFEVDDVESWCSVSLGDYYSNPFTLAHIQHFIVNGQEVKDLVIPGSVTRINDMAFLYAECINSVTIEEGVNEIGELAFFGCWNLARVSIPGSVRNVEYCAFYECVDLASLTLGEGIEMIEHYAFGYCDKLTEVSLPGSIKTLQNGVFYNCQGLKTVHLNEGLQSMNDWAFSLCTSLENVTIPASLNWMGYCAFAYDEGLKSVTFEGRNPTLDDFVFYGCTSLRQLTLPSELTRISLGAFSQCASLVAVEIPATVTAIDYSAFAGCTGLTRVDISDLKTWCGINFADASANPLQCAHNLYLQGERVTELVVPQGVKAISANAFNGATGLTAVALPAGIESIGDGAFKGCSKLTRVDVPDVKSWLGISFANEAANPLSVARHLYVGGEELAQLVVPAGVASISDYAFNYCESLTGATIANDVTAIGKNAFTGCKNLKELLVGDGVKTIGEKAFGTCTSLTDVTLGEGLETMGARAFVSCMKLSSITVKALTPPELGSKDCFVSGVYKNAHLMVPEASVADYQAANHWDQFKHIEAIQTNTLIGDLNGDGELTVNDVNLELAVIYGEITNTALYDLNGDGEVNICDVNTLIDLILSK